MRYFSLLSLLLFLSLLSACGGKDIGPPHPSDTNLFPSENSFTFYLEKKIHPVGKFQVLDIGGEKMVYETPLPVQWTPRDPDLPDLGKDLQVFPKEGFKLSNLEKGEYLFRIVIFHKSENQGDVLIASIETRGLVKSGQETPLDFSKSSWNYPNEDGDGFSNIAELADGYYEDEKPKSPTDLPWSSWNAVPTDPKDPNSYPSGPYLISPEKIHPTSPDDTRNSELIGEILSVQAGTQFTAIHFASDGTVKEKINFSSKIDGSFEVNLKNSEGGDQVAKGDQVAIVLASKTQGDQIPDLSTSESESFGKLMKITYRPLKMIHCRAMNGIDPIGGNGYVLLEGEGISVDPAYSKVRFPTAKKGEWTYANDISLFREGQISRALKVKIPEGAVSGYPQVQTTAPRNSWGECPTNQPVIILPKSGELLPDFVIPRVEAPHVALLGQTISVDVAIGNQGVKDANLPFPYSVEVFKNGALREIYPNSRNLDLGSPEKINFGLRKGEFVFPTQTEYFLTPSKSSDKDFIGSLFFRGSVGLLAGGEQDPTNNGPTKAEHGTFIHYVDLQFLSRQIKFDNTPIDLVDDPSGKFLRPKNNPNLQLSKKTPFTISLLGEFKNNGTFPLVRDSSKLPIQYYPNPPQEWSIDDPLITSIQGQKTKYEDFLGRYLKKEHAEGEKDLDKSAATELIEQANLLNQRTELPVLIRVYYSPFASEDKPFSPETEIPIQCPEQGKNKACEFCINRLEREKPMNIADLTLGPLQDGKFVGGPRRLFIVAEAIRIDPKKVNKDKGVDYCAASDEERKKMHSSGSIRGKSLADYNPADNIIMIPIYLNEN